MRPLSYTSPEVRGGTRVRATELRVLCLAVVLQMREGRDALGKGGR